MDILFVWLLWCFFFVWLLCFAAAVSERSRSTPNSRWQRLASVTLSPAYMKLPNYCKLYFSKTYFSKVYFSKLVSPKYILRRLGSRIYEASWLFQTVFSKAYFSKVFFSKLYFSKAVLERKKMYFSKVYFTTTGQCHSATHIIWSFLIISKRIFQSIYQASKCIFNYWVASLCQPYIWRFQIIAKPFILYTHNQVTAT